MNSYEWSIMNGDSTIKNGQPGAGNTEADLFAEVLLTPQQLLYSCIFSTDFSSRSFSS